MKTTKGGKVMNPTDAYRKELRKKELKRNKKERKKVREVGILKKDPEAIKDQIQKLEMMKADGALDKARKHKKRQLEDTLNMVMKKRKEYQEKMREKGETPVMFSHLGPPRRAEDQAIHPNPEDSVYYHPTLNPTGAPPPGKPPMYKSATGAEIPSTSTAADGSTSNLEEGDMPLSAPPPPPPPPPLPDSTLTLDDSNISLSVPPPPPPPPGLPKPGPSLSLPPLGVPPPPRESTDKPAYEDTENQGKSSDVAGIQPPPPPPGLPPNHMPIHQPGPIRFPIQPDMLLPGISHISGVAAPPPPPPPYPPGMGMAPPLPLMPRPPFGGGHGLPPMFRPPLPPGQPFFQDNVGMRPQKPSYVKSAASTVVKRPLAQHNLELTAMVPASVRVRRETSAPKLKPRAQLLAPGGAFSSKPSPAMIKSQPSSSSSSSPKRQSIDDSYTAFLEDMKALGALDS